MPRFGSSAGPIRRFHRIRRRTPNGRRFDRSAEKNATCFPAMWSAEDGNWWEVFVASRHPFDLVIPRNGSKSGALEKEGHDFERAAKKRIWILSHHLLHVDSSAVASQKNMNYHELSVDPWSEHQKSIWQLPNSLCLDDSFKRVGLHRHLRRRLTFSEGSANPQRLRNGKSEFV